MKDNINVMSDITYVSKNKCFLNHCFTNESKHTGVIPVVKLATGKDSEDVEAN